jgi:hypothetical protein
MRKPIQGVQTVAKLHWPRGLGRYIGKDTVVVGAAADEGRDWLMVKVETVDQRAWQDGSGRLAKPAGVVRRIDRPYVGWRRDKPVRVANVIRKGY